MKIGIIGCGLIGRKRLDAVKNHQITVVCDLDPRKARELANVSGNNPVITADWEEACSHPDTELLIIAATNNMLYPMSKKGLINGKHILVEKPCGTNSKELLDLKKTAELKGKLIKAGFNHRHHPAFLKAAQLINSNPGDKIMFIRARYGHGGRIGYDKEWRSNPVISGGGELIDQGVHLIDLSRWFMGEFTEISGSIHTYFWDMRVEDNSFIHLQTSEGSTAWLHASCTEWKNIFSFEIYTRHNKYHIEGLGGSYGIEKLFHYKMLPQMGPPETVIYEYPFADNSWQAETQYFLNCIEKNTRPEGSIDDALAVMKITEEIYRRNKK